MLRVDTLRAEAAESVNGDAAAGTDPVAMKQMVGAFRSIVTEELINHKRQRSGLVS